VAGTGQVVDSERDADSVHQIVDVWQAGGAGAGCDGGHGHVEAAAVGVGVGVDVAVAVEESTVAEGPSSVVDVGTQGAAAGQPWAVEVLEEHTVVDSRRTVDTGCTVVEEVVGEVELRVVVVDMLVVEDDYVFAASACLRHNRSLHTRHFVREVALVAVEESMQEYKLRSPVVAVAVAAELQPSKRNSLEGRQSAVDLEVAEVGVGCTSAAV